MTQEQLEKAITNRRELNVLLKEKNTISLNIAKEHYPHNQEDSINNARNLLTVDIDTKIQKLEDEFSQI